MVGGRQGTDEETVGRQQSCFDEELEELNNVGKEGGGILVEVSP